MIYTIPIDKLSQDLKDIIREELSRPAVVFRCTEDDKRIIEQGPFTLEPYKIEVYLEAKALETVDENQG